jgi:hypothetical protein
LPAWARYAGTAAAPLFLGAAWGWYYYEAARPLAMVAALGGVVALGVWAIAASRSRRTTQLRNERLSGVDAAARAVSGALAVALVAAAMGGWGLMGYNPFDGLQWPPFEAGGATVALLCAWPAVRLFFEPRSIAAGRAASLEEAPQP